MARRAGARAQALILGQSLQLPPALLHATQLLKLPGPASNHPNCLLHLHDGFAFAHYALWQKGDK